MLMTQRKPRGPAQSPSLPGSQKSRQYSKRLTAMWLEGDRWLVSGGRENHIVIAGTFGIPKSFMCDCSNQDRAKDNLCSHVIAVMREM